MKTVKTIVIILLFFAISLLSADEGPKIMVINSNAAIDRYRTAEETFMETLPNPVLKLDLGTEQLKLREMEELLYDHYPDLVYCIGTKAYLLANKFISDRNIIFSSIIDWQRLPTAPKTSGISSELNPEMQITLYRYMLPEIKRIGVLYSPKYNNHWFEKAQKAAEAMDFQLTGASVSKKRNTLSSLKELIKKIDALWLISDPVILSGKETLFEIFKICDRHKIPILTYYPAFAEYGAMMVVSVDDATTGRQAAAMSQEVLSGDKATRKVQLPAGSHIMLNMKKADAYGLKYSERALSAVNRIIE